MPWSQPDNVFSPLRCLQVCSDSCNRHTVTQIKLEKLKGKLNMGKSIALSSALIFHYILVLFIGMGLTTWGFVGSLSLGTFSILLTTAIIGTGLIYPATIVCMLLIGLGVFNGLWIFPLVTAAGISFCMLSDWFWCFFPGKTNNLCKICRLAEQLVFCQSATKRR